MISLEALGLIAALAPLVPLSLGLYNRATWPRPRPKGDVRAAASSVSVLIPARNEARNIRECLQTVLAQGDVAREVIVYSDESTDDTESIVRSVAAEDPRVQLIVGGPLPDGWVGKPHACQVLAEAAQAPVLLFVDADVRLGTGAVRGLLAALVTEQGQPGAQHQVLTGLPRQIGGTWSLDLLQPLLVMTYVSWLPLAWASRQQNSRLAAGCGQLLMLSKATHRHVGGFRAVRRALVDDVAFCRHAIQKGARVTFVDAYELSSCRMYESGAAFWRGFSKNVFPGLGSELNLAIALALHAACFLLPFGLLGFLGVLVGLGAQPPGELLALACTGVIGNVLHRAVLAERHGHRALAVVLHPLAVLVLLLLALDSWRRARFARLEWAGRSYEGGLA